MECKEFPGFYYKQEESQPPKVTETMLAAAACSNLEYKCAIDIEPKKPFVRQTCIICTIGPASQEVKAIETMIENGMNAARLDFSTETPDYHLGLLRNVRQAVKNYSDKIGMTLPLAIGVDIKGPEIRTGLLARGAETKIIEEGTRVKIATNYEAMVRGTEKLIFIDYKGFCDVAEPGDVVILDKEIKLEVQSTYYSEDGYVMCDVVTGGVLGNRKRVNLPRMITDLPAVSEKDKLDIAQAIKAEVDMVFASHVRDANDIAEYRSALGKKGKNMKVIAKIQNILAWENIDEIIDAADGIMVDRGNLAIEIPQEKVFQVQKTIIARCNKVGKPVFVSSQMLDSMITKSKASVRECTDIANAILDGVDGVMLSGETYRGAYPLESVITVANICKDTEAAYWHKRLFDDLTCEMLEPAPAALTVIISAIRAANKCQAGAIVVMTSSGATAQLVAKYRPRCPILAVTCNERVARLCNLHRSVVPVIYNGIILDDWTQYVDARVRCSLEYAKIRKMVKPRDPVVVVSRWKELSGFNNIVHVVYV